MVNIGKGYLLPSVRPGISKDYLPELPTYGLVQWIVGRGSVIWTVWPAVVVHSLFATRKEIWPSPGLAELIFLVASHLPTLGACG